jgi:peptidoglycan/LPS O-acetylase OafA/YrhL
VRRRLAGSGPSLTGFLLLLPLGFTAVCSDAATAGADHIRAFWGAGMLFALACFSLLVLLAANECAFPKPGGRCYRFLTYLGDRSYTYYVFNHTVLLAVLLIALRKYSKVFARPPVAFGIFQVVVGALLLALVVEVVYRRVEVPLTRIGKRLIDGKKEAAPAVAAPPPVDEPLARAA